MGNPGSFAAACAPIALRGFCFLHPRRPHIINLKTSAKHEVRLKHEANVSMTGKTLGHYRAAEQLGRVGMGEVYIADDLNLK